ncbi:MAG: OmpA family protein [Flavobacteriales bacterium]|nr:OmpA family protein [Flavobacteriales bacterium]
MCSLRSILILGAWGLASAATGQQNLGMASGNYAGITGAWLNPASIVDSRYKFDMVLFGYDAFFTNNYLQLSNNVLRDRLFSKPPYNASREDAMRDLMTPVDDKPEKVHGATSTEVHFPFSFMARTGPRSAFALNIRNRSMIDVQGLDAATAQMIYDNLANEELFGQVQDNSGFGFSFMNWMEVGLTFGRVMVNSGSHFLKAAGTLKLMAGASSIHMSSDDLQLVFDGPDTISIQSPLIRYGRTERGDVDTYGRRNLMNGVEDWALGWDVGVVYELRGDVAKRRFIDLDNTVKERQDLNKYILRVGVSLLDAGHFKFTRRELAQDHSANITGWDISQVHASDLDQWDAAYSELVEFVPDGSPTYTHRLPTAVAANVDLRILGGFYVNVGTYRDATRFFPEANTTLRPQEWVAITPRFENRWFGFYVPMSRLGDQSRIGATIRLGPVFFGSNNLADQWMNPQNVQADYHFGARFSIGHGKPSAVKRKYEAWRMQQTSINRNSTRIDSLEREVYALRMAMQFRTARPTVINNFFGTDSASLALARDTAFLRKMGAADDGDMERLIAENEQLSREVARRRTEQPRDTVQTMVPARDRAMERQQRKVDRASARLAQAQVDAIDANAKQMQRIEKQMRRQNRILAAGAVTGVVAAASSGKGKEQVTGPAIFLNDSTIVLGEDTLRLVIPAGSTSPIPVSVRDTAFLTIRDTVRVVDTLHIVHRDTTVIEREVQAPGTITLDEAALKRLLEPVYFATGKTTLGPQGLLKVEELADWLNRNPEKRVEITGVADASGSVAANERVAQARAESVREGLIAKGVNASRIATSRKLAPAGAAPDPRYRRAEVRILD